MGQQPNTIHRSILEEYFFNFIDGAIAPEKTPLFTKTHNRESLAGILERQFEIPLPDVEKAIELARQEVTL